MAQNEITGASKAEVAEMREQFENSVKSDLYDFEEWFCLFQIPFQPEEYEGEPRFCKQTAACLETYRCRFHRGRCNPQNLLPPGEANYKHGGFADIETVKSMFTDDQQALYDDILTWAETYHIEPDENPSEWHDLEMLAGEAARQLGTSKWLRENGETVEVPIFSPDGMIADYETQPSKVAEEHRRITQLVLQIKKDLGLSRKDRMKMDDMESASDKVDALAETMGAMVGSREKDYDPDEYEFVPEAADSDDSEAEEGAE